MTVAVQHTEHSNTIPEIHEALYEAIVEYEQLYRKIEAMPEPLQGIWERVLRQCRANILATINEVEITKK